MVLWRLYSLRVYTQGQLSYGKRINVTHEGEAPSMNPNTLLLLAAWAVFFQAPPSTPLAAPDTYALGPGDQIVVRVPDFEEIDGKPVPIDLKGSVNLPSVGRFQASGLTTEQLESAISERLRKFLVKPDVSVYLVEMRSQPVSLLG